ncbi:MAG TPA: hypothetical protein DCY94_02160, partial [Firmicutes bacterium]|nr:hypothetical protein [Bacillota bacterium]
ETGEFCRSIFERSGFAVFETDKYLRKNCNTIFYALIDGVVFAYGNIIVEPKSRIKTFHIYQPAFLYYTSILTQFRIGDKH